MTPLPLRKEEPPHDDVVVVRGGAMGRKSLRGGAARSHTLFGLYGLSVYGAAESDTDVLLGVEQLARYGLVRLSSFGVLRTAGFAVLPSFVAPHFTVVLAHVDDALLDQMVACFGPAVPNPWRRDVR